MCLCAIDYAGRQRRHGHANQDAGRRAAAHSDCHYLSNANRSRRVDQHVDTDGNANPHADANPYGHCNTNTNDHSNHDKHAVTDANADRDSNRDGDPHNDPYANTVAALIQRLSSRSE